ncbi:RNA polymerase sigma-70 factor [Sphingobacterium phlebotomi]|uniref:RNA polymerase sigma-70 factor n=1 Tax=Sphingobacterium phlebotomi TaxID=2605433 RepID=A0A5D4GZ00_9SPHI|nr:RNA polymerase sigma-70 factor [Sphingobacterium phlebotomi]TYR33628.1 RNA polymerase sigma-70 factor [Sphingobacterium phlebotomi]
MANYKEATDKELVSLLKEGNKEAFAEIYDRYAMPIYYKVNQILRDEEMSKDLVQELFTAIWTHADNLWDDANLSGYLYVASRNRVLKLIQKGKTKSDYLAELGKYSSTVSYDTLDKLDEKELMLLVMEEIAKLPLKMREVFQLSRLEDLSHKEIAARLQISEATVRKQIQYALRILKSKLANYSSLGILLLALFREN